MNGKVKLTIAVVVSALVLPAAALAAAAPVSGGHYKGHDSARGYNAVRIAVSRSRANFSSARFDFLLSGPEGLGSCAGRAYVTVKPTRARQISRAGRFTLSGSFTFDVPTGPYPPTKYTAHVSIAGAFYDRGGKVSGTLRETASSGVATCHSGKVRFSAALIK